MTLTADILRPHQAEIIRAAWRSISRGVDLFCCGSRGVGKTHTLARVLAMHLRILGDIYHPGRVLVAAMTHQQAVRVFLSAWQEQALGIIEWTYNGSSKVITLESGWEIVLAHAGGKGGGLASAHAGDIVKGESFVGAVFPEAISLSAEFLSKVIPAIRQQPAPKVNIIDRLGFEYPCRFVFFDTNPEGPDHHLYRRYLLPSAPEWRPAELVSIATTPATSLWSAREIELMRIGMPAHIAARELDAEWAGASGALYHLYDGVQVTADPLPPGGDWFLSLDFGYEQDPYVALLIYRHGGHAHVMGEVARLRHFRDYPEGGMYALVRTLMAEVGADSIRGISGDLGGARGATGLQEQAWWGEQLGAEVGYTVKDRHAGWMRLVKAFIMPVTGSDRPVLTIHPSCEGTIASLSALTWRQPKGDDVNDVKGDDHADALRYFMMSTHSPPAD